MAIYGIDRQNIDPLQEPYPGLYGPPGTPGVDRPAWIYGPGLLIQPDLHTSTPPTFPSALVPPRSDLRLFDPYQGMAPASLRSIRNGSFCHSKSSSVMFTGGLA